jgi:hypothetical protein
LSDSLTCRLQRRSLFAYLTDVLTANIRGDPSPHSPNRASHLNAYPFLSCVPALAEGGDKFGDSGMLKAASPLPALRGASVEKLAGQPSRHPPRGGV